MKNVVIKNVLNIFMLTFYKINNYKSYYCKN
jgi:hypothetical protein